MAFTWENTKNPTEIKRYAFNWSGELGEGDTITGATAALVAGADAGLTLVTFNQFDAPKQLSYVLVEDGIAGQTAAIQGTVTTANGETLTEVGYLVIAEPSDPADSTLEDLKADLKALREARVASLTNQSVKEVWRDGRRVTFNVGSVADISKAIREYEDRIEVLEAEAAGTKPQRFRALRPRF